MDKPDSLDPRFQLAAQTILQAFTEVNCQDCGLDPVCAVLDYGNAAGAVPEGVLLRRRPVERGQAIFHQEDPFRSIFAVKSGAFKTFMVRAGRPDQVIGFQFPGELIGVEAMSGRAYPCTARALGKSSVCELHIARLPESGRSLELLQSSLIDLLGKEVAFNHQLVASLVHQSAEQRISGFILSVSGRLARRGLAGSEFTLPMSRSDIGSYLGLASETVSRVLTRLDRSGAIRLRRKRILIRQENLLERFTEGPMPGAEGRGTRFQVAGTDVPGPRPGYRLK